MIRTTSLLACALLCFLSGCADIPPDSLLRDAERALARAEFEAARLGFEAVLRVTSPHTDPQTFVRAELGAIEASKPRPERFERLLQASDSLTAEDLCRIAARWRDRGWFDQAFDLVASNKSAFPGPSPLDALTERLEAERSAREQSLTPVCDMRFLPVDAGFGYCSLQASMRRR